MFKLKSLRGCSAALIGGLVILLASAPSFAAFEGLSMMRMGAWEVDFSGNVNSFATFGECERQRGGGVVAGGLACTANADGTDRDFGDIRTGLLPAWLNFSAATTTGDGWRTGVHISFQPGANTNSPFGPGFSGALGLGDSNFRQVFLTLGKEGLGTFKIGRDLGVFSSDAILNDMTLLGVGSVSDLTVGDSNTSLGRIGVGYLYADWKAQLQYSSPSFNGFTFTLALVDPWAAGSIGNIFVPGVSGSDVANQEQDTFGFEGKVNYSGNFDEAAIQLWAGFIFQDVEWNAQAAGGLAGVDAEADGFDVGGKVTIGDLDVVAYYYDGDGIGTTGFLIDGFDLNGNERESDGYYFQGRYRLPTGTLAGVSYGESRLERTSQEVANNDLGSSSLVRENESYVIGLYHPIGEALNLVAEYTVTEATAHSGDENEESSLALGAIMFF